MAAELCPACVAREQDHERSGLCGPCYRDRLTKRQEEEEEARAEARRAAWRERQRRSRRYRSLRPDELPDGTSDPLELGAAILGHFSRLVRHLGALEDSVRVRVFAELDVSRELVKQLAWGPEEASITTKQAG